MTVALANKECVVAAGAVFRDAILRSGASVIPVDSEHNAVFQVLGDGNASEVERVTLTPGQSASFTLGTGYSHQLLRDSKPDAKGAIIGVELPESQRAKTPVNWFDPATMEGALGRLGANFGPDTRIATIKFDDWTGGRVTIGNCTE